MMDAKIFFSQELLSWFHIHKRTLPWRQNRDPYRVWVSEIMLQQTRVDTVIPYYERFMARFPTVAALAAAPEEEVLKCWEGLGYYSRARNLQAGAQEVVERYGGVIPDDAEAVAGLKGIGPYTRGAVMSIAFNRAEPAVDGNVMRVLSRYFCLEDDIAKNKTRIQLEKLAVSLIPDGHAGDFNQALMELGALVCTPKSPGCLTCPVMEHCAGRLAGKELVLPIKTKAKPPREERRLAAIVEGSGSQTGKVLVRQRPASGLLARMWELPHVLDGAAGAESKPARGRKRTVRTNRPQEHTDALPEQEVLRMERLGLALAVESRLLARPLAHWMEAEHVFSHIIWKLDIYRCEFGFVLEEEERQRLEHSYEVTARGEMLASEAPSSYTLHRLDGEYPGPEDAGSWAYTGRASGLPDEALTAAAGIATGTWTEVEAEELQEERQQQLPEGYRWISREDMDELAFPNVFLRILNSYWEQQS